VVRYYGASYIKTGRGLKFIMVMEICKESLKDYYTGETLLELERFGRMYGCNYFPGNLLYFITLKCKLRYVFTSVIINNL